MLTLSTCVVIEGAWSDQGILQTRFICNQFKTCFGLFMKPRQAAAHLGQEDRAWLEQVERKAPLPAASVVCSLGAEVFSRRKDFQVPGPGRSPLFLSLALYRALTHSDTPTLSHTHTHARTCKLSLVMNSHYLVCF